MDRFIRSHKAFEINLFQLLSGGSCSSISHRNRVRKIDFDGSIDLNSSFEPEVNSFTQHVLINKVNRVVRT